MVISDLIKSLTAIKEQVGDKQVYINMHKLNIDECNFIKYNANGTNGFINITCNKLK